MSKWHTYDVEDVLQELGSDKTQGLSQAEAARRLAASGPNELVEKGCKSAWVILWEQVTATMVVILIVAAIASATLGDYHDAFAILAIVVLFSLLGFSQEYRAEKAMAALKKLAVPTVKVQRSGQSQEISARELVVGDLVLLETGDLVPADCRLLESVNLRIQEASLTGESEPVEKKMGPLEKEDLPLGDRRNMAYMGTMISYGRGQGVVTDTGMRTELGRIASMIQSVNQGQTPLQKRLDQLGKVLAVIALGIASLIFLLGLWRGEDLKLMFMTAVSMAVAAVPEGLPAVVTIALALGAQRMLKRHALIRKLPAVETLGSVTVICSDKTGTLTENRMTVTLIDLAGHRLDLTEPDNQHITLTLRDGLFSAQSSGNLTKPAISSALGLLMVGGTLCNDALLQANGNSSKEENGEKTDSYAMGDPTESALVLAAARLGLGKTSLEQNFPRISEVPFDSERKRMTTVHHLPRGSDNLMGTPYVVFTKGAVDSLLEVSTRVWVQNRAETLTDEWRARITATNDGFAQEGIRVLGVAFRSLESLSANGAVASIEQNLIFIGMVGMIDPARPEVKDAVQTCKHAGIRPVMITGDHPLTAYHIAQELGISNGGRILTGRDLERLSPKELEGLVEDVSVYARVSPEHKLKIVEALQNRGHVVAMTGDGVNDAPALKKADIGIAMGITGTDVAKEASDMVLQDDNFATIVAAVEEGRTIYDNIRKFIKFSIAGNLGKILVVILAPFLGMPLPLLPLQILWLNLLTDGLLGLGLSVEPAERNAMQRPPIARESNIFGDGMGRQIFWVGFLIGLVSLWVGYEAWQSNQPHWQTLVFTTLAFLQIGQALAVRSFRDSVFQIGPWSNKLLLGMVVLVFGLQLAVVYVPFLQDIFTTVPLSTEELAISLGLGTLVFWGVELEKWLIRHGLG
ncbi:MAG: cation-translocating P-type ATPase [Gloeobacterales cyanobacterium]